MSIYIDKKESTCYFYKKHYISNFLRENLSFIISMVRTEISMLVFHKELSSEVKGKNI